MRTQARPGSKLFLIIHRIREERTEHTDRRSVPRLGELAGREKK